MGIEHPWREPKDRKTLRLERKKRRGHDATMKEYPGGISQLALPHRARGGGVLGAAQSSLGAAADHGNDDRRADDQRRGTAADAQPAVGQGGPGA